MIYKLILSLRNARYRGGRHSSRAGVPTVCIGNITVGGTGKTPHIEMLLRELLASEQWGMRSIAVLSRGYKRRSKGFQQVPYDGTASRYGDEPLQIKRKFPSVTVAVDKDRVEGCDILEHPEKALKLKKCSAPEFPAADIILLDDAYQYRKLKADTDIVLTDYDHPVSEDSLLPFGRLRDLKQRLYDADIVIVSKCPYALDASEKEEFARRLGWESYDPQTCIATRKGRSALLLFSVIEYDHCMPVAEAADSRYTYSHKAVLFSGIADDTPLRNHISDTYKIVEHLRFPDHHRYAKADVRKLRAAMKRNPTAAFITTEKDAQRLRDLQQIPAELRERLFCIPIKVAFSSESERALFLAKTTSL